MTTADNAPKTEATTEATPVAAGTVSGEAETTGGEHLASHDAALGNGETTGAASTWPPMARPWASGLVGR